MYTYAILKTPPSLQLPDGIQGHLQLVSHGEIAAVVEPDLALETLQTDDNRLLQAIVLHDRILTLLFQQTTILPLRFGTCFVSQAALLDHLVSQQPHYLSRLHHLEGKAEYQLKLTQLSLPEPTIPAHLRGKDYFLAKKQQYQAQVEQQQQQQQELQALIMAVLQTYSPAQLRQSQTEADQIYLLVDRLQEARLTEQLADWQSACPHWQLGLGERMPPYHFL